MSDDLAICIVCHAAVPEAQQAEHLASAHPAPKAGFVFHFDARRYHTYKPSMMVTELLLLVGATPMYPLFQKRLSGNGDDVFIPQGCAVDMTQDPWFYAIPPATF
jgi:hypothetical protein